MFRSLLVVMVPLALVISGGCGSKQKKSAAPGSTVKVSKQPTTADPAHSAKVTSRDAAGNEVDLAPVYFEYDDATLSEDAREHLTQIAASIRSNKKLELVVEGHCDERGTTEYNIGLGERRARAIKEYLVSLGVSSGRVETISFGKERPAVAGKGEDAWAKNRRGQLVDKSR